MATVITQADDQSSITVPSGTVVELHLAENPTTGFQWSFDEIADGLDVVEDRFHMAGTPLVPGAAGVHEWRMRARGAGNYTLRMKYSQPWESETAPDRRFSVDIVVT
ncbi:MAG: protease inhibitor I42 family protein [Acidimicrobiia bacterium]|nr:protease inhibitor I42 family protein [Acidimicrobiia bacterium]